MNNLSIIYSSAHKIPEKFAENVREQLYKAAGEYPIHENHCSPETSSITNYYNSLLGVAREITTPYIAFAEDDTLYPDEHFNQRPSDLNTFAYNDTRWNIYTWSKPPFFSLRQRKILATLIAPREAFIKVMEDRVKLKESQMVEPGRRGEPVEIFNTYNPVVVFTHKNAFGYMGGDKRANKIRATALPYWGSAESVMRLYE